MKFSTYLSYFVPLLVAKIVSGTTFASALTMTQIRGGAQTTTRGVPPMGFGRRAISTQHRAAFIPIADGEPIPAAPDAPEQQKKRWWGKVRDSMTVRDGSGLTLKEKMAKQGFAALVNMIFVNNLTSISFLSFAWYGFSVQTGLSPLCPGQWKPFLAVFSGFMAMDVMLKPVKIATAIAAVPLADRAIGWLKRKCGGSKSLTMGLVLAWITVSAFGMLGGGVTLASTLSGVPIFAP
ncbi:expressed unknown protein [Seminavis robusta]|uniref:Uncharacterized protein n=1 Tax=Seminavis robusta TaxID=568900 RepID=A0A9N8H2Y3_9STRA|nr:expressed unknown protein [Seminavis robusta]|eukprot:Sro46_g027580.1 n/a (236) ;mRNA; r:141069-141776